MSSPNVDDKNWLAPTADGRMVDPDVIDGEAIDAVVDKLRPRPVEAPEPE